MNSRTLPPLVIVSGLSGSGKSMSLNTFEDLGYYCVDNLPAELLPEFVRRILANQNAPEKIAIGIDARSLGDLADVPEALSQIGAQGLDTRLLFFETRDEVLLRRYADTRRRHPLSHLGLVLADAISLERQALKPLRQIADRVLDTSDLNVHQMRRQADDLIPPGHGVDGAVDPYIVRMGIGYRRLQLVRVKVSGEGPHTEVGARQIYGVRAVEHGHFQPFHISCRSQ